MNNFTPIVLSDFGKDTDYIYYYVNLGQNIVTGAIPLISLTILNYLVYKHLKDRRGNASDLGIYIIINNSKNITLTFK